MYLKLGPGAHIVGIDVSAEQLDRNSTIHERILGDVQSFPLDPAAFDVVICWDVLEHLARPRAALDNLAQALRPGGLLVLGGPNPLSLKGLATWVTPYWLHQLWYRRSGAAPAEHAPFKTYRRIAAIPQVIVRWGRMCGLTMQYMTLYESPLQREFLARLGVPAPKWQMTSRKIRTLTRGTVDPSATDFMLVVKR